MEAKHLTTKALMRVLYGMPKLIETTQKELLIIDSLAKSVLPRGNDLPHSARDLARLLEQQKELIPNKFYIWLRYRYRPQKKLITRVHRNHTEISNIYYEYFIRQGNADLGIILQSEKAAVHSELTEHIDTARNNIDYLLGISELVGELQQRYGLHEGYMTKRVFRIVTLISGSILGVIGTLITQHFTK